MIQIAVCCIILVLLLEGYRKAQRIMDMAEKFEIPVISLVDTAGAYPGLGAEERGQAEENRNRN